MVSIPDDHGMKGDMQPPLDEAVATSAPSTPNISIPDFHIRTPSTSSFGSAAPLNTTMAAFNKQEDMISFNVVTKLLDRERKLLQPDNTTVAKQLPNTTSTDLELVRDSIHSIDKAMATRLESIELTQKLQSEQLQSSNNIKAALANREVDIMVKEMQFKQQATAYAQEDGDMLKREAEIARRAELITDIEKTRQDQMEQGTHLTSKEARLMCQEAKLKRLGEDVKSSDKALAQRKVGLMAEMENLHAKERELGMLKNVLETQKDALAKRGNDLDHQAAIIATRGKSLDQREEQLCLEEGMLAKKQATVKTKEEQVVQAQQDLQRREEQPILTRLRDISNKIPLDKEDQVVKSMQGTIDKIQKRKRQNKTSKWSALQDRDDDDSDDYHAEAMANGAPYYDYDTIEYDEY